MFFYSLSILFVSVLTVECTSANRWIQGEKCQTEEGVGRCVHIYNCLSSIQNNLPICSFRSDGPVVCCNDCELVNDARNAVVYNDGGIFLKSGQKARDKCLEHLTYLPDSCQAYGEKSEWDEQRQCSFYLYRSNSVAVVFGGYDALRSSYPHMTLLGYGNDEDSAQWLCGGSLISERFVLTAAHCLWESAVGPVRFVAMGILRRSDPSKFWHIRNVKRVIAHPKYKSPSMYHDIALLETATPVIFSKDVFPACLDYDGEARKRSFLLPTVVERHNMTFATGWGKLGSHGPLADNLQVVGLQEFSKEECQKQFPPYRLLKAGFDANTQMCFGDKNEAKDTCKGDSGGPLQVYSEFASCVHTIIGVTSFGRSCIYAGNAGMYTRVYPYVPWIESIVWPGWS